MSFKIREKVKSEMEHETDLEESVGLNFLSPSWEFRHSYGLMLGLCIPIMVLEAPRGMRLLGHGAFCGSVVE